MRTLTTAIIENGRATEWLTGSVLLVFALTLSLPGDTLARSSFAGFGAMGLEETSLAVLRGHVRVPSHRRAQGEACLSRYSHERICNGHGSA